ncbi:hypothetical protein BDQ17DRAFT_1332824 [Cyathus striatus]|nr:hypothetical protein BDQ17DRAFT_1332824 [Cyathus striatus]
MVFRHLGTISSPQKLEPKRRIPTKLPAPKPEYRKPQSSAQSSSTIGGYNQFTLICYEMPTPAAASQVHYEPEIGLPQTSTSTSPSSSKSTLIYGLPSPTPSPSGNWQASNRYHFSITIPQVVSIQTHPDHPPIAVLVFPDEDIDELDEDVDELDEYENIIAEENPTYAVVPRNPHRVGGKRHGITKKGRNKAATESSAAKHAIIDKHIKESSPNRKEYYRNYNKHLCKKLQHLRTVAERLTYERDMRHTRAIILEQQLINHGISVNRVHFDLECVKENFSSHGANSEEKETHTPKNDNSASRGNRKSKSTLNLKDDQEARIKQLTQECRMWEVGRYLEQLATTLRNTT